MIIMAFEDEKLCEQIYSLLLFYLDNFPLTEPEKIKAKGFLEKLLVDYLGWTKPLKYFLSDQFDEEKFYAKISG